MSASISKSGSSPSLAVQEYAVGLKEGDFSMLFRYDNMA